MSLVGYVRGEELEICDGENVVVKALMPCEFIHEGTRHRAEMRRDDDGIGWCFELTPLLIVNGFFF